VRARLVLMYAWLMYRNLCLCRLGGGGLCVRLIRQIAIRPGG
jgi:hypothetical protein